MKNLVFAALAIFLTGCASAPMGNQARKPATEDCSTIPALKDGQPWDAADPMLKCGDLTVQKLQQMALQAQGAGGDFTALNDLFFNKGVSLSSLPAGYSVGAGMPFPVVGNPPANKLLEALTGDHWRGKIFFRSGDQTVSHGLNRISPLYLVGTSHHYQPTAAFKTYLLTPDDPQGTYTQLELAKGTRSNFVVLNYAFPDAKTGNPAIDNPRTKGILTGGPALIEKILKVDTGVCKLPIPLGAPVFDVMVAVPGKNGPIYVGRTWLGKYDKANLKKNPRTPFTACDTSKLIAWYFLDFNQAAYDEQMAGQNGTEDILDEKTINERQ